MACITKHNTKSTPANSTKSTANSTKSAANSTKSTQLLKHKREYVSIFQVTKYQTDFKTSITQ